MILEPDAAAVACLDEIRGVWKAAGQPDVLRYIVADCGGGTVEIAVHDLCMTGNRQNTITEVIRPSGGPWGGTIVDSNVLKFVKSLIGENAAAVDESAWEQLERVKIEEAKRDAGSAEQDHVKLELPPDLVTSLQSTGVDLKVLLSGKDNLDYRKRAGAIIIGLGLFEKFFKEPCRRITSHLHSVMAEAGKVHCLLLVGGFAQSAILRRLVQDMLESTPLVNVSDASLAVVRGAVMFGQNPKVMRREASPKTRQVSRARAMTTSQLELKVQASLSFSS